ncbi:MAG: peptidoglycan-associated lipoprotein [Deltaproteobacteria bacterium RIFCSPLOWO2_12_FULL_60_19]|nr:MAG: peptidoglycan-associated lipoprotein [Deltaproteobacteria bacterium RIFCSPLOWO2_12_FULL_60_19]
MDRIGALYRVVLCSAFFTLAACASPTQPPTEPPGGSLTQSDAQGPAGIREATSGPSTTTGGRSLQDAQAGKLPVTPPGSPLKEVYFGYDRYDLDTEARATLKANADWLKANVSARVEVEGHCDERGTSEYNLALGAKRSQAVKDYLATLGVAATRLSTISYGEELPVCKEQTEDCWQKNRRARFVIVSGRPAS